MRLPNTLPLVGLLVAVAGGLALGQTPAREPAASGARQGPMDAVDLLLEEVRTLRQTIDDLRLELAQARLDEAAAQRQLDEMHQFIRDHDAYGDDFQRYQSWRTISEQEARQRQAAIARQQRAAQRSAQREAVTAAREQRDAQMQRVERYRQSGFTPLGFDVFVGNAAFQYPTDSGIPARVDWNGLTGRFIRLYPPVGGVVFSSMTFSGSVLNASSTVRNIGIAVTFFDEQGNQVGGEVIQVDNARPDVPYPFTSTIAMALDRPFASSSTYVLYADPVDATSSTVTTP